MLNDITLGQFFPGDSLLHKADPRAKILFTFAYIVLLFVSNNLVSFLFVGVLSIVLILVSRIPVSVILKGINNELGWLPETMFADGIQKTIQWYLDNKEWWQTIISGEYQSYYERMYGNR